MGNDILKLCILNYYASLKCLPFGLEEKHVPTEDEIRLFCLNAATDFAARCKELRDQNPYNQPILEVAIVDLVTELWDRFFSQSEIKKAFESALAGLPRYAADEERRGENRER